MTQEKYPTFKISTEGKKPIIIICLDADRAALAVAQIVFPDSAPEAKFRFAQYMRSLPLNCKATLPDGVAERMA